MKTHHICLWRKLRDLGLDAGGASIVVPFRPQQPFINYKKQCNDSRGTLVVAAMAKGQKAPTSCTLLCFAFPCLACVSAFTATLLKAFSGSQTLILALYLRQKYFIVYITVSQSIV